MPFQTKLKKWWEVYAGDEEKRFFVGKDGQTGLARSKFEWRSTDALVKESGLSGAKVESIISKYHKAGMILQHPKNPEKWGYWERVDPKQDGQVKVNVVKADQEKRIDKAKKKK